MPRPVKSRLIRISPPASYFKPRGVPLGALREMVIPLEGLEALRLADVEKMDHQAAADLMNISRPTFSRVLASARTAVAQALVNGWAVRIEGGSFEVAQRGGMGGGQGRRGRGRGRGPGRI